MKIITIKDLARQVHQQSLVFSNTIAYQSYNIFYFKKVKKKIIDMSK